MRSPAKGPGDDLASTMRTTSAQAGNHQLIALKLYLVRIDVT